MIVFLILVSSFNSISNFLVKFPGFLADLEDITFSLVVSNIFSVGKVIVLDICM